MSLTLYRIIKAREPTLLDFMSLAAQGLASATPDDEIARLQSGISCWATEAQARRTAKRFPALGSFVATVDIPDDAPVRIERTRGPGHHTVWGTPSALIGWVTAIGPV